MNKTDDAPFDLVDNGTCSPVNGRLVPERPRENVTLKKHVNTDRCQPIPYFVLFKKKMPKDVSCP